MSLLQSYMSLQCTKLGPLGGTLLHIGRASALSERPRRAEGCTSHEVQDTGLSQEL